MVLNNSCPLCKAKNQRRVFVNASFSIVGCPACGLRYRNPQVTCFEDKCQKCHNKCIDKMSDPLYFTCKFKIESRRIERIRILVGGDLSRLKVLEMGVGTGVLASLLRSQCFEYRGVEVVPFLYKQLTGTDPGLTKRVTNGLFPPPEFKNSFDVIIAVDVLEFVTDPLEFLEELKSYLNAGGRVYFELPNEAFIFARGLVRKVLNLYAGMPVHPAHNFFFTKRSLQYLLRRSGLEVIVLTQASLAGDHARLGGTLKRKISRVLWALSWIVRVTKLDLLFQQGNYICIVRKVV